MKAIQSVGQIIAEVLKQLDDERFKSFGRYRVIAIAPPLTLFVIHQSSSKRPLDLDTWYLTALLFQRQK